MCWRWTSKARCHWMPHDSNVVIYFHRYESWRDWAIMLPTTAAGSFELLSVLILWFGSLEVRINNLTVAKWKHSSLSFSTSRPRDRDLKCRRETIPKMHKWTGRKRWRLICESRRWLTLVKPDVSKWSGGKVQSGAWIHLQLFLFFIDLVCGRSTRFIQRKSLKVCTWISYQSRHTSERFLRAIRLLWLHLKKPDLNRLVDLSPRCRLNEYFWVKSHPEISAWSQTSNCLWCPNSMPTNVFLAVYITDSRLFSHQALSSAPLLYLRQVERDLPSAPPGLVCCVPPLKRIPPPTAYLHKFSLLDTFYPNLQRWPTSLKDTLILHCPAIHPPSTCHVASIPAASTSPCGLLCFPSWLTGGARHRINCNCYQKTPGVNKLRHHHAISLCFSLPLFTIHKPLTAERLE